MAPSLIRDGIGLSLGVVVIGGLIVSIYALKDSSPWVSRTLASALIAVVPILIKLRWDKLLTRRLVIPFLEMFIDLLILIRICRDDFPGAIRVRRIGWLSHKDDRDTTKNHPRRKKSRY